MLRGLRAEPSLAYAASQHRYDGGMLACWHAGMLAWNTQMLQGMVAWWHAAQHLLSSSILLPTCCAR